MHALIRMSDVEPIAGQPEPDDSDGADEQELEAIVRDVIQNDSDSEDVMPVEAVREDWLMAEVRSELAKENFDCAAQLAKLKLTGTV